MGNSDYHSQSAVQSSIVLLQERFRELQRVKEMRQERELLRMLSESDRHFPPSTAAAPSHHHVMRYFDQLSSKAPAAESHAVFAMLSQTTIPTKRPAATSQLSLSLGPNSQHQISMKNTNFGQDLHRRTMSSSSTRWSSWLAPETTLELASHPIKVDCSDNSDVDTSLHL